MHRLRYAVLAAFLTAIAPGCGEDQPNASTPPEQVTPDFAKQSSDMMKAANSGMDPKKANARPK